MTLEEDITAGTVKQPIEDSQSGLGSNGSPIIAEMDDLIELEVSDKMGYPTYKAHWQLFVPTIVIFVFYTIGLGILYFLNMAETSLFRLFSLVLGVGVPLLAVHAFLRYQTVRLQFSKTTLRLHKGWPKDTPVEVPYSLISDMKIKRGLAGRLFGGGTVIVSLTTDNEIVVADLLSVKKIQKEYRSIAKRLG